MHRNSVLLFRKYGLPFVEHALSVLEISPGSVPSAYQRSVGFPINWQTVGLERRPEYTYVSSEEYHYPIDRTFDVVISGQVLEHVRQPWEWMKELARLSDMYVITIAPATWPYHEAPVDCWRVYPEGMKALYEYAGLQPVVCKCENLDRHAPFVLDTIGIGRKL